MLGLQVDRHAAMPMPMRLAPAELVFLHGPDAVSFAHAQFTSDVKALAPGRWQWSAWLDAQGRVRHFFLLARPQPDRLLAWLPLGGAAPLREALARYVLRARLSLTAETEWSLHGLDANADTAAPTLDADAIAPHGDGFAFRQPGGDRIAWLAPSRGPAAEPAMLERWRARDVEAGLPLLAPELGGEFVPQALDLERLDAIRFDKGCYPGQEIAARLHFRGGNKRSLRRLSVNGLPPPPGAQLRDADGTDAGRVLYAAAPDEGATAIAVLRIDIPQGTDLTGDAGTLFVTVDV